MTEESRAKLRALLAAFVQREAPQPPAASEVALDAGERRTQASGDRLREVVRPVLDACVVELRNAGHAASVEDHTDGAGAYPSVALSFTPRGRGDTRPRRALASVLAFRYDPRRGIVVHRDVRAAAVKGKPVTMSADRGGTIGIDAVSAEWVETKTLNFVEAVLKVS